MIPFTVREWNIWTPLMPEFRTAIIRCFLPLENSRFSSIQNMIFGESGAEDLRCLHRQARRRSFPCRSRKKAGSRILLWICAGNSQRAGGRCYSHPLIQEDSRLITIQFIQKYNQQFGELYLELVSLREQMAQALGYDSYTQVVDLDMLQNSYTREDIKTFRGRYQGRPFAPVYRSYLEDFYRRAEKPGSSRDMCICWESSLPFRRGSWQETLDQFEQLYQQMSEQTGECYSYLLSPMSLLMPRPSQTKANVTFSTLIYSLNTPILFANMNGSAEGCVQYLPWVWTLLCYVAAIETGFPAGRPQHGCQWDPFTGNADADFALLWNLYGEDAGTARKYERLYHEWQESLPQLMNDEFQEKDLWEPADDRAGAQLELYKELTMGDTVWWWESLTLIWKLFRWDGFTTNQYFRYTVLCDRLRSLRLCCNGVLQMGLEDYTQALETSSSGTSKIRIMTLWPFWKKPDCPLRSKRRMETLARRWKTFRGRKFFRGQYRTAIFTGCSLNKKGRGKEHERKTGRSSWLR